MPCYVYFYQQLYFSMLDLAEKSNDFSENVFVDIGTFWLARWVPPTLLSDTLLHYSSM